MKMFGLKTFVAAGALALLGSQVGASTLVCPEDDLLRQMTLEWNGEDDQAAAYSDATLGCLASGVGAANVSNGWMNDNGWTDIGVAEADDPNGLAGIISATVGSLFTGLSGTIQFDDPGTYDIYAMLFKVGAPKTADSWFVVQVTFNELTQLIFNWSVEGQQELSHTSLWGMDPTTEVPLPAGGLLLLTALGGMALVRRRKMAAA